MCCCSWWEQWRNILSLPGGPTAIHMWEEKSGRGWTTLDGRECYFNELGVGVEVLLNIHVEYMLLRQKQIHIYCWSNKMVIGCKATISFAHISVTTPQKKMLLSCKCNQFHAELSYHLIQVLNSPNPWTNLKISILLKNTENYVAPLEFMMNHSSNASHSIISINTYKTLHIALFPKHWNG